MTLIELKTILDNIALEQTNVASHQKVHKIVTTMLDLTIESFGKNAKAIIVITELNCTLIKRKDKYSTNYVTSMAGIYAQLLRVINNSSAFQKYLK